MQHCLYHRQPSCVLHFMPEKVVLAAVNAEPAPKPEAPAAVKAEAGEEGGSPLAPILGTVLGIIVVAIAAFSSNAKSAEAYEAEKKAKESVTAGECEVGSHPPVTACKPMMPHHHSYLRKPLRAASSPRERGSELCSPIGNMAL